MFSVILIVVFPDFYYSAVTISKDPGSKEVYEKT